MLLKVVDKAKTKIDFILNDFQVTIIVGMEVYCSNLYLKGLLQEDASPTAPSCLTLGSTVELMPRPHFPGAVPGLLVCGAWIVEPRRSA